MTSKGWSIMNHHKPRSLDSKPKNITWTSTFKFQGELSLYMETQIATRLFSTFIFLFFKCLFWSLSPLLVNTLKHLFFLNNESRNPLPSVLSYLSWLNHDTTVSIFIFSTFADSSSPYNCLARSIICWTFSSCWGTVDSINLLNCL